jgi:stearoyl-CoA desaturase (delta-9 desaturase)
LNVSGNSGEGREMIASFVLSLVVAAVLTQAAVMATTIYLHRTAAHKALLLHPSVIFLCRLTLWLTTGLRTLEWVAVHRKHHAYTDEEGDPHSPRLAGFWSVQLGNVFLYMKEAKNPAVLERYARDIPEGWWDRVFFNRGWLGLTTGTTMLWLLMGSWAFVAAGVHAVMYVFVLSSSINGLCHAVGYRNFQNTATNLRVLALLTGGEGLHNNHHEFPRSPKFSFRATEIDPAWPLIQLLIQCGLATSYKTIDETA